MLEVWNPMRMPVKDAMKKKRFQISARHVLVILKWALLVRAILTSRVTMEVTMVKSSPKITIKIRVEVTVEIIRSKKFPELDGR